MDPVVDPALKPLYRYLHPQTHDYFYTLDPSGEAAPAAGYRFECIACFIFDQPQPGMTKPLYRWVKANPLMHFYTTDPHGERAVAAGFRKDDPHYIAGHVLEVSSRGTVRPVRLHRWYATKLNGSHFYTTDGQGPGPLYVHEDGDMGDVFAFDQKQWMRYIDDSKSLAALTIPGTHDTATYLYSSYGYTKCQDVSLTQQLEEGIRFLDIRLKYADKKGTGDAKSYNDLWLFHGNEFLGRTFQHVVDACSDFLTRHPSECIVMQVKNEAKTYHRDDQFEARMRQYVASKPGLFSLTEDVPTLGHARGRIVLVRRFKKDGAGPFGINLTEWPNNQTFQRTAPGGPVYTVQDKYESFTAGFKSYKFEHHVKPFFEEKVVRYNRLGDLFVNFTSGTGGVWPRTLATGIESGDSFQGTNQLLFDYLAGMPLGRYGIVPMDFPSYPYGGALIRKLVSLNELSFRR